MKRRGFLALAGALSLAGCGGDGAGQSPTETSPAELATPTTRQSQIVSSPKATSTSPPPSDTTGEKPTATLGTVESLPPPSMGDPDSDITVQVFEDFACPHCRDFHLNVLPDLESGYVDPGTIRYEHHDFPIPVNKWSWPVANAARAVQDLADDATFFAYTDVLFENQGEYSWELLASLAADLGVEGATVERAAKAGLYRSVLETDRELALEMNAAGTPQVYVNGRRLGDWSYDNIARTIEGER